MFYLMGLTGQFIIICWITFIVYWVANSFSNKRTALKSGWENWNWRLPIFIAIFLLIVFSRGGSGKYLGSTLWHKTLAVGLLADLITLSGITLAFWARKIIAGNWSSNIVIKENHELVQNGPYAYIRHPIYSGMFLMMLGAAIISGRLGAFLIFIIFFSSLWFKASQEEKLLIRHFPDSYPQYKAKTKKFIPFIF